MPRTPRTPWEYKTLDNFVEFLADDARTTVEFCELETVSRQTRTSISKLRRFLSELGITMNPRPKARAVRGFTTSSNDRWFGPGSERTHGGSGFDNRE